MSINFTLYRNANESNRLNGAYPNGDAPVSGSFAISSISGTWAEGNSLTISGAQFGADGPKIIAADNFYGKTNNQAVTVNDPPYGTYIEVPNESKYDTTVGLGGNPALLYHDALNADPSWRSGHAPVLGEAAGTAIRDAAGISSGDWTGYFPWQEFVFYAPRYGLLKNDYNAKDSWMMYANRGDATSTTSRGNDIVLQNTTTDNPGMYFHSNSGMMGGSSVFPKGSTNSLFELELGRWNYEMYKFTRNSSSTLEPMDYFISVRKDLGEEGDDDIIRTTFTDSANPPDYWDRIKLGGYSVASSNARRWFGAIYLAVSDDLSGTPAYANCRVEVYNNSDPAAATVFGVLPPSSWSASSITVDCWTLGIAANDVHIRVVDKNDNKTAMFKLT